MTTAITLPGDSRYKDTVLYTGTRGPEFGLFTPPAELVDVTDYDVHVVVSNEIGFLDKIAVTYYGNGYEPLWWVIAQVNGIIDPERDMTVGMRLIVPKWNTVAGFVARPGDG